MFARLRKHISSGLSFSLLPRLVDVPPIYRNFNFEFNDDDQQDDHYGDDDLRPPKGRSYLIISSPLIAQFCSLWAPTEIDSSDSFESAAAANLRAERSRKFTGNS